MRDINYHKQAHKCLQQIAGKNKRGYLGKRIQTTWKHKAVKPNQPKIEKPASPV